MKKNVIQRREFIKNTCGSCGAIGLSLLFGSTIFEQGCKATAGLSVFKTTSKENRVAVPVSLFENTNFKLLRVADYEYDIGLQKQSDGSYLALLLMCTHAGQALNKSGEGYYCTLHGSRFSKTGNVVKGPASHPLKHLKTIVDRQDILITLEDPTL